MRKFLIIFLSVIAFAALNVAAAPHAYPVPFTPGKNELHKNITFVDLPGAGTVKIFTIDGRLVKELSIPTGASLVDWNVTNDKGEKVATGIYLFLVQGPNTETRGKLVIIR